MVKRKRKIISILYKYSCMLTVDGRRFDSDREVDRAKQGLLRINILSRKTPITGMWLASCHFQGSRASTDVALGSSINTFRKYA